MTLGYLVPVTATVVGIFRVSERGEQYLSALDATAITPGGLDAQLAQAGYAPSDLPRFYAGLAQECFLSGHNTTAVVMLGVASEALIDDFAKDLSVAVASVSTTVKPPDARASARVVLQWVKNTLELTRKPLKQALDDSRLDVEWLENLRDVLDGTGQAIRLTRNESGHPTGVSATYEEALQLLTLFPRFAALCRDGSVALRGLP